MKVVSVNIGEKREVSWRGKIVETGIFKYPISTPVLLGKEDVDRDMIVDRKYHGGIDKACYVYSADHYHFWKSKFPDADWSFGMFGENLTVEGLNERNIQIGDIYRVGGATVQVVQPREPCFKLGIRFGTQTILKEFINQPFPGIYLRVIDPEFVKTGDAFELIERQHNSLGLLEIWDLLYKPDFDPELLQFALELTQLAEQFKKALRKRLSS